MPPRSYVIAAFVLIATFACGMFPETGIAGEIAVILAVLVNWLADCIGTVRVSRGLRAPVWATATFLFASMAGLATLILGSLASCACQLKHPLHSGFATGTDIAWIISSLAFLLASVRLMSSLTGWARVTVLSAFALFLLVAAFILYRLLSSLFGLSVSPYIAGDGFYRAATLVAFLLTTGLWIGYFVFAATREAVERWVPVAIVSGTGVACGLGLAFPGLLVTASDMPVPDIATFLYGAADMVSTLGVFRLGQILSRRRREAKDMVA